MISPTSPPQAHVTGVKGMATTANAVGCSFSHIPRRSGDTHMARSPTWPESRQPSENTHCEEVEEDQS